MTVQCCVCKQVHVEGEWVWHERTPIDYVSHSYCPPCLELFQHNMMREWFQAQGRKTANAAS